MLYKMALISLLAGGLFVIVTSCTSRDGSTFSKQDVKETPLESALDSAEILFLSPESEKIIKRIHEDVLHEKPGFLRNKGLRIFSTVLLSRNMENLAQLDSAASFAKEAEKSALSLGDSLEWALCKVQLFRYRNLKLDWHFVTRERIGHKEELLLALRILEYRKANFALSLGYQTLAHAMDYDNESAIDVLNYNFRALRYNDSLKYPLLRAFICNEIAVNYINKFNRDAMAEKFFLRAIEILKHSHDTLYYIKTIANLAFAIKNNDGKSLHYYRLAANVAKSGGFFDSESDMYFKIAERFQSMGKYDSALFYSYKSIAVLPKTANDYENVIFYRDACMARSYVAMGQSGKARQLVTVRDRRARDITIDVNERNLEFKEIAEVYAALSDFRKLSEIQGEILMLRDSLLSRSRLVEVGRVESRYELELKNNELKVLQISNRLHAAEAERELWVRFLLITTAVITTLGLLIVVKLLAQQNQLNESLAKQNATIEQQKIDLESSLQELQRAQAHVLTSEKMAMLGQFTAGVAHELNNPLNFISGGVSVLEEAAENAGNSASEEEMQILRNIRNGVDRAIAIVNSLRVFSNPRSEIGIDSHADLAECIKASLLVLQSKIKKEGVAVATDFTDCVVVGHSGQLCQIFINLIDNAIHAVKDMPQGQKNIEIRSRSATAHVLVDIRDSGVGIPESIQSNLFQAFFTTKPTGQGIGLGLFICDTILRGIGGSIMVTSKDGEGAMFTVQFMCPK